MRKAITSLSDHCLPGNTNRRGIGAVWRETCRRQIPGFEPVRWEEPLSPSQPNTIGLANALIPKLR